MLNICQINQKPKYQNIVYFIEFCNNVEIDINTNIFDKKYVLHCNNVTHTNQKGKYY